MPDAIIAAHNLNFYYPGKHVLKDVSFTLEKGSITALVGPNGAGKSTLMRSLAGLDMPFSGKITIAGIDVRESPRLAHTKMGYLSDSFGLYNDLSVRDVLEFIGGCHGLTGDALQKKIAWVINLLHLEGVAEHKCSTLSRGWRQRAGIAMTILHNPDILMLDEPASGLDPEARSDLSMILKSLQSQGMSILVSSHILAELEEYSTAMLVLRDGTIKEHVSLANHQQQHGMTLRIALAAALSGEQEQLIRTMFQGQTPLISAEKTKIHVGAPLDGEKRHLLLRQLLEAGLPVSEFAAEETSLQSLYLKMSKIN